MTNTYKNIVRLKVVAKALAELQNKAVFVGGAVANLYADDPAQGEVRPTDDIDVVVEIINRATFAELEERLRAIGFRNDVDSGIICRYRYHDIIVDVMPSDGDVSGFTNRWYKDGVRNCIETSIDLECKILILTTEYFLATKFEALFAERHGSDYRWNSDFEDIIYVFDNRENILKELTSTHSGVRGYLKLSVKKLLKRPFIDEEISTNLEYSSQDFRKNRIINIWKALTDEL